MLTPLPDSTTYRPPEPEQGPDLSHLPPLPASKPLRVLDFDSECMPDGYLGNDYTTSRLTAIAARFVDEDRTWCYCLQAGRKKSIAEQSKYMLYRFVKLYDAADIVTGHNIRRHDLPMINGSLVYFGMPQLRRKLTSDTLLDGPKAGRIFSRSQENLGEMLEVLDDKYHMNASRWKVANTLEDVTLTRERVMSDVEMHIQVRAAMLERGLIKAPRHWRP